MGTLITRASTVSGYMEELCYNPLNKVYDRKVFSHKFAILSLFEYGILRILSLAIKFLYTFFVLNRIQIYSSLLLSLISGAFLFRLPRFYFFSPA